MQKEESAIQSISNLEFCVFDLETTGGNQKSDKIIEIGLVKIQNLKITDKKSFLIKPERSIPEFIQRLTSIKPEDLEDCPTIEEVMDEILEFMGDTVLVAHNASFDVPFFNSVLRRMNREKLANKSICTNLMTKYLIPNLMNSNLNYMSRIFEIPHQKAHRALDDAEATAELLLIYIDIFISKNIQKINHLYYPKNRYELDRMHFKGKESTSDIVKCLTEVKTSYLFTLKGENGVFVFSHPAKGNTKDIEYITKRLESENWQTATIRLFGPFIETLIHHASVFNKLTPEIKSTGLEFLWNTHLPNESRPNWSEQDTIRELEKMDTSKSLGDFLITNHIVPEQYIIYPLRTLHHKMGLTFRYPGHKKKLLQFISAKSSKGASAKEGRLHVPEQMKDFIHYYLKSVKDDNKEIFFFNKGLPLKRGEDFFKQLETFIENEENISHYPKDHI